MQDQLRTRLQELKSEQAAGEEMLADLQIQQANLERTLLRIGGAIQVLEELLATGQTEGQDVLPPATESHE